MTEGNKITCGELQKPHEITLAKCGWLVLVWVVYPERFYNRYELRSNGETIGVHLTLPEAVFEYNELVS